MKKILLVIITIMIVLLPATVFAEQKNQIEYGDFEGVDNIEDFWEVSVNKRDESYNVKTITQDENTYALINCITKNYVSLKKPVFLKANSTYEIGAKVKYSDLTSNEYGYIKLENDDAMSNKFIGSVFEWHDITFYVTTLGSDVYTSLEISVGSIDSLASGKLYVDDIYVKQIDNINMNSIVNIVDDEPIVEQEAPATIETKTIEKILSNNQKISLILILFCLAVFMLSLSWYSKENRIQITSDQINDKRISVYFAFGLILISIFKYFVASLGTDLPSDIGYFTHWSNVLANQSMSDFYTVSKANYPAGYMYVLLIIGKLANALHIGYDSLAFNLILKTPPIIFEIFTSILIYKIAHRYIGKSNALIFSLIVFLNPAVLINTSAWCQVDIVFIFLISATLYFMEEDRYYLSAVMFAISMLVKTQSIFFIPIIGMYYILLFVRHRDWKKSLITVLASIVMFIVLYICLSLPFRGENGIFWAFKNFLMSASTYNYVSMNGFNFYTLFGANYAIYTEKFLFFSYQTWGYIFIVLFSIMSMWLLYRNKDKHAIFLISAFLIAGVFTFGHGMHERYILPVPILLMFAYCYQKDRKIITAAMLYTIFALFSQISVLFFFGVSFYATIEVLMSIFSLFCFGYLAYIVYSILISQSIVILKTIENREEEQRIKQQYVDNRETKQAKKEIILNLHDKYEPCVIKQHDKILMLVITLVYAIIAFVGLGSFNVPKNGVNNPHENYAIEVDFSDVKQVSQVKYYTGIGQSIIDFETLDEDGYYRNIIDNESADGFFNINHDYGKMYRWNFVDCDFMASKVRITIREKDFDLKEIAFIDNNGKVIEIKEAVSNYNDANQIHLYAFDEQTKVPDEISYKQGMYFDEIYHARSALEHIEGREIYEVSHPPLGKSIISIGIRIFGMNPFGWRFMGALFGVLMLPLMYLFSKKVFKRTYLAFIATTLLAVDFMHFAQTRIATIDSFSVFFIMLMFYFMYDYYTMNFNKQRLTTTLIPLALCGISFGLGASTKWLCLYAGMGLAFVFFYTIVQRFREYNVAKIVIKNNQTSNMDFYKWIRDNFVKNLIVTLLWCVLFFVVVPIIIYYLSYAPYMRGADQYTFANILENQEYMYNYHSLLNPDTVHPFASKWYSWIFDIRPMLFFRSFNAAQNTLSTISSFGNPFVWWALYPAIIIVLASKYNDEKYKGVLGFVLVAGLCEVVPWIFISRETYIYHYFATVPFLIMLITFACKYIWERTKKGKFYIIGYLFVCIVAFALFYPVISGMTISTGYAEWLRWLDSWPFY